jgi:hypothetical protein
MPASILAFLLLLSFMMWPALLLMVTALLLMISLLLHTSQLLPAFGVAGIPAVVADIQYSNLCPWYCQSPCIANAVIYAAVGIESVADVLGIADIPVVDCIHTVMGFLLLLAFQGLVSFPSFCCRPCCAGFPAAAFAVMKYLQSNISKQNETDALKWI